MAIPPRPTVWNIRASCWYLTLGDTDWEDAGFTYRFTGCLGSTAALLRWCLNG